ncbi:uncharacterized protein LOC135220026 isoform X2 [Macrobrachium nipponense]|uniref:uncharacterized protein LOC135220026 isoform X2 n=1 Tax=Macrobrachium nipponense TaxID=159736 RepID=UPI0030C7A827
MTVPVAVQESVHQAAPALAIMVTASVCRAATYAVVPCSLKNAVGQIVPAALKAHTVRQSPTVSALTRQGPSVAVLPKHLQPQRNGCVWRMVLFSNKMGFPKLFGGY